MRNTKKVVKSRRIGGKKGKTVKRKSCFPLHDAASSGNVLKIRKLILLGLDVNCIETNESRGAAIHAAARRGKIKALKELIKHKADVNIKNKEGWTPLAWAAARGHDKIVKELLKNGADPNITDKIGRSPLHHANQSKKTKCINILKKY
jgi:ankyrin repeat protein